jgi:hypothetical protein
VFDGDTKEGLGVVRKRKALYMCAYGWMGGVIRCRVDMKMHGKIGERNRWGD